MDVPAKIRRSPGKAAAIAGGTAFVVLGGPRRVFRAGQAGGHGRARAAARVDAARGGREDAARRWATTATKVRGALERDFAAYAKQAQRDRASVRTLLLLTVARPLLSAATQGRGASWLFRTDDEGFQARLAQIRERDRSAQTAGRADAAGIDAAAGRRRRDARRRLTRRPTPAGRADARLRRGRVAEWQTRRP